MFDLTFALIIAAAVANGILSGASLDQSIKQLPARRRMGAIGYSVYSRARDLGNGIVWYAGIGIGAAVLAVAAATAAWVQGISPADAPALYASGVFSILHSLVTTQAAPTIFSQRLHIADEAALAEIFDRFAHWQTLRAVLQLLTFVSLVWALASYGS